MSDSNWQLEAVDQFMKSPEYRTPIMNYIDEKCVVFDDDEENKLEFTKIHEEFVELVFGLLERFLGDLGLSTDDFAKACSTELHKGGNTFVYHSIMAADDFQSFKKMMAKRNYEFQLQAIEQLRNMQFTAGMCEALPQGDFEDLLPPPGEGDGDEEDEDFDEELQLREAIRLSKMTFNEEEPELSEALRLSEMTSADEASDEKGAEVKPTIQPSEEDIITPEELQSIKDLPIVTDQELMAVRAKHELAVIHHAIAINEVSSKEEEEEEEEEAAPAEEEEEAAPASQDPAPPEPVSQPAEEAPKEETEPAKTEAAPPAEESSSSPASDSQGTPSEPVQVAPKPGGSLPAIVVRARPAMDMPSTDVDDLIEKEKQAKKKERKAKEKEALQKKAAELETVFTAPQELSPEEMEKRKVYLEKQRSLILDKKKKERDEQLKLHTEQKQGGQPDSVKRNKSHYEKVASEVLAAVAETTRKEEEVQEDEETKKLEMRRVLAKRILEDQHV